MTKLRVTIDTNVFVSGIILERGFPYLILELWRENNFLIISTQGLLIEVEEVLKRTKLTAKYHLTDKKINTFVNLFKRKAKMITPIPHLPVAIRDPKDAKIITCALGGKADYLVTGDKDLLILRSHPPLQRLQIIEPKVFYERIIQVKEN